MMDEEPAEVNECRVMQSQPRHTPNNTSIIAPRARKPCSLFQRDYNQLHHLCISLDRCINGVLL